MSRPRSLPRPRSLVAILLLTACGVSGGTSAIHDRLLAQGTWGGVERGAIVTATGVHIHIGCTKGDFPAPIELDSGGRFRVDGRYILRAYPIERESLPAQMSGLVEGNQLTFTIAVNDTVVGRPVALGPVTVTLGVEPRMANCPICRTPPAGLHLAP